MRAVYLTKVKVSIQLKQFKLYTVINYDIKLKGCSTMPFTGDIFPLSEIEKLTLQMVQMIKQQSIQTETEHFMPLEQLEPAIEQFFDLGDRIETEPGLINSESEFGSVSELGDYGLQLFAGLEQWFDAAKLENKANIQMSILSLAIWVHNHDGVLQQLENIVNALSELANHTNDTDVLTKLHKIAEKVTNSAHEITKTDLDKSDPGRPWRILNLNHGIIATRTHNTDIINTVFEQLLQRLPEDAANFFADGMKQMELIGYPEHVKHVMEHFYNLTNNPTLH